MDDAFVVGGKSFNDCRLRCETSTCSPSWVLSGRCYDVQNGEDNFFSTDVSAQKHTFRYERQHDAMIEITLLTVSQFFISLDEFRQTIA